MSVGASCSGSLRWRVLGKTSDLLCPLHRQQLPRLYRRASGIPAFTPLTFQQDAAPPSLGPPVSQSGAHSHRRIATRAVPSAVVFATVIPAGAPIYPSAPATAAAAAAAAAGLSPALVTFISLLPSIGTFLLCLAGAALLLASIPAVWALARTAHRAERLMAVLEAELPDTVASMRLAGLEVTDCIQELGALGGEMTRGVRSTVALVTATEAGVRGGVAAADLALRNHVVPAVATAERNARGAVEEHLVATSKLSYTAPLVAQAASATTVAVRRLRAGLAVGHLVGAAVQAGRSARASLLRQQEEQLQQEAAQEQQRQAARQQAAQDAEAAVKQRLQKEEHELRRELEALRAKQQQQQQQQQRQQQKKQQQHHHHPGQKGSGKA